MDTQMWVFETSADLCVLPGLYIWGLVADKDVPKTTVWFVK